LIPTNILGNSIIEAKSSCPYQVTTFNNKKRNNMKKTFPVVYILLSPLVLAGLISSCSAAGRLLCPKAGEEISTQGPGEEYVSFTI